MPILPELEHEERTAAVRGLLRSPLVARSDDPDLFTLVSAHHGWLTERFDEWCGWPLRLDFHAGTARLIKRRHRSALDATRPVTRASGPAFDQQRYSLLMSTCAELVSRPHATIGDVADAISAVTASDEALRDFDVTERSHRGAFVDVLRWLIDGGYLEVTTGDLDQFAGSRADAVLRADVKRLATLFAAVAAPSRIAEGHPETTEAWLDALTDEPRYGHASTRDDTQRTRWGRHQLLRAVLDDPAVDVADLPEESVAYLRSPTGRRVVLDAVADAGLRLERHAEVLLAIDETRGSTDTTFGERASTVAQVSGVILRHLLDERRAPTSVSAERVVTLVAELLDADPEWAKGYQTPGGARNLATEAVDHLVAFGLARRAGELVVGRPTAARYAVDIADHRRASTASSARVNPNPAPPSLFADPAEGPHA